MSNVIKFPKKGETKDITPERILYLVEQWERTLQMCNSYSKHLKRIKKMSLWDRIFNWPY